MYSEKNKRIHNFVITTLTFGEITYSFFFGVMCACVSLVYLQTYVSTWSFSRMDLVVVGMVKTVIPAKIY